MHIGAFIGGFLLAVVIDFVLSVVAFTSSSTGPGGQVGLVYVAVSWATLIALFLLLFRASRWAGYGFLGGFAALFTVLVLVGGAAGPYSCFSAFGYPALRP